MQKQPYFIGLDIGTSRVRCAIGMPEQNNPDVNVTVIGVGSAENQGMRKGYVAHPDDVAKAITEAVGAAERMAGVRINIATINMNGASVQSQSSTGMISTNSQDRIITDLDRERVEQQATVINMPQNREIVQVFAKNYRVDGQDNIKDPVGMQGVRLEVDTLVVTAGVQTIRAVEQAMNDAQISIMGRTVSAVAASEVTLSRKQRESGTAIVDIGAGTTNIAIVEDGEIYAVAVLPIGGQNVTNDLAIGLKTDLEVAEKVKVAYGSLDPDAAVSKKVKIVHEKSEYSFDKARIYDILVPRFEELLEEIDKVFAKVKKSKRLPGGVVFVGGVAKTPGLAKFAQDQLELHTRIGTLQHIGGIADNVNDSEYASVIGLMILDGILGIEAMSSSTQKVLSSKGLITKIKNIFLK